MSDFHERLSAAEAEHIWQTAAEFGFLDRKHAVAAGA